MKANKTKVIAVSVVLVLLASAMFTVMSIFNNKVYANQSININETTTANTTIDPTPTPSPSPSPMPSPSPSPSPTQNVEMPKTGDGDDFIIYGVIGVLLVVGIVTFVRIKSV